jgi:hypothetical protein
MLGGDDGLLKFIYDGEAYTIGKVLIEHGNRYDVWNMIDHSALRQERSARSRKLPVGEEDREERYFIPPSGTHLVIEFINRIKARYRFVDLLKPETNAVIPILIALEPEKWLELDRAIKAGSVVMTILGQLNRYFTDKLETPTMPRTPGNMGVVSSDKSLDYMVTRSLESLSLENVLRHTLGHDAGLFTLPEQLPPPEQSTAPRPRRAVDYEFGPRRGGVARARTPEMGNMGLGQWLKNVGRVTKKRFEPFLPSLDSASAYFHQAADKISEVRYKQLHAALRRLNRNDQSFSVEFELAEYQQAAHETATKGDFEAIVYGHTHLPKKLLLTDAPTKRWYLNTGTWADVIRLPDALAGDYAGAGEELKNFVAALKQNDFSRYVHRYLTFVELLVAVANDGAVHSAGLHSFCGDGKERSAPLTNAIQGERA